MDYTFIDGLEDKVIDLVDKVQSDKSWETTGYIGMLMTTAEFALIPGTTPFTLQVHLGVINYNNPTQCTTIQQHTERKYEHTENLHVFKTEHTLDEQMKGHHVFFCFE